MTRIDASCPLALRVVQRTPLPMLAATTAGDDPAFVPTDATPR